MLDFYLKTVTNGKFIGILSVFLYKIIQKTTKKDNFFVWNDKYQLKTVNLLFWSLKMTQKDKFIV